MDYLQIFFYFSILFSDYFNFFYNNLSLMKCHIYSPFFITQYLSSIKFMVSRKRVAASNQTIKIQLNYHIQLIFIYFIPMKLLANTHLFIVLLLLYVSIASQIQENYHPHHYHHHHHHHRHHHRDFENPSILDCQGAAIYDRFHYWVERHNKKYDTPNQNYYRFSIFQKHCRQINQHNRKILEGESGYIKGLDSQFSDQTPQQFSTILLLGAPSGKKPKGKGFKRKVNSKSICSSYKDTGKAPPATVDWRLTTALTAVKDQGSCGSCWAFSTTGSVEALQSITTKKAAISLSQQQLIECADLKYGNYGCGGGDYDNAYKYIMDKGIALSSDYPYMSSEGISSACNTTVKSVFKIKKCYNITSNNPVALKRAIVSQPVSVAIQATLSIFQDYAGGIIDEKQGCGNYLDHAVLVVGYKIVNKIQVFIIKNSWGTTWGDAGYMYISTYQHAKTTPNGVCGILSAPAIPAI